MRTRGARGVRMTPRLTGWPGPARRNLGWRADCLGLAPGFRYENDIEAHGPRKSPAARRRAGGLGWLAGADEIERPRW